MRKSILVGIAFLLVTSLPSGAEQPVAPNGIALYSEYLNWQVVAPSYREDKSHIRIITGNEIAIAALRAGQTPLPDGSVLAKVAWQAGKHAAFPVATVPEDFVQVEFMVKDAEKFKKTGGWGFARFVGEELTPYGKDPEFVAECFGCHIPVADNDYLFTRIIKTP